VNNPGFEAARVALEREAAPAGLAAQRRVGLLAAVLLGLGALADAGQNIAATPPDRLAVALAGRPELADAPRLSVADVDLMLNALHIAATAHRHPGSAAQVGRAWDRDLTPGGALDEAVVAVRLAAAAFSPSHAGAGPCCLASAMGVGCDDDRSARGGADAWDDDDDDDDDDDACGGACPAKGLITP
jgi:hypothetical protein